MENELISAKEMIEKVFSNIEKNEFEKSQNIVNSWKEILESINSEGRKYLGKNLYDHSRIIDLKNEILLVEADHPGWIQTLKIYQKYILNGLKRYNPSLKISSLAFRLKGSDVRLADVNENEIREERMKNLEKESEILKKFDKSEKNSDKNIKVEDLPENLRKIFENLKNDMLTNSE